jgi:hypothetical protein
MYQAIGGMEVMDDGYWRLWPLPEIVAENQPRSGYGLLFSDYLICSWCYRLKPQSAATSAVYLDHFDGAAPILVAANVEQFFDKYAADADFLHKPPSP